MANTLQLKHDIEAIEGGELAQEEMIEKLELYEYDIRLLGSVFQRIDCDKLSQKQLVNSLRACAGHCDIVDKVTPRIDWDKLSVKEMLEIVPGTNPVSAARAIIATGKLSAGDMYTLFHFSCSSYEVAIAIVFSNKLSVPQMITLLVQCRGYYPVARAILETDRLLPEEKLLVLEMSDCDPLNFNKIEWTAYSPARLLSFLERIEGTTKHFFEAIVKQVEWDKFTIPQVMRFLQLSGDEKYFVSFINRELE